MTFGRVWRELCEEAANEQTVLELIANGEFHRPMRVIVFNTAEGWSRDVTIDIADELRRRYVEFGEVPEAVLAFMEANQRR